MRVRSLIGLIAIACFAAQAVAISKSGTPGKSPVHCVPLPFGECENILASGYGQIIGPDGRTMGLDGFLAILVPLTMWVGIVFTTHNPTFWMMKDGKKRLSPGAWGYLVVYGLVLVWAATRLTL